MGDEGASRAVPEILPAGVALPGAVACARRFSCVSYNVLLPNSQDGWWIYKYYRRQGDFTEWPRRQEMLRSQLLRAAADVICLQEVSELSFSEDFGFLAEHGYAALLHNKKGRMRPATFWRREAFDLVSEQHKDRSLVLALRRPGGEVSETIFVVNSHLSAGPEAARRVRQAHEALETVAKEAKRQQMDPAAVHAVYCGDFNSQGATAVRELLVTGEVLPAFRESGDPTEQGQEGLQLTSKPKRHLLPRFQDAVEATFAAHGRPAPATILVANIDSKMKDAQGALTPALVDALNAAFNQWSSGPGAETMTRPQLDAYLTRINKGLGRGDRWVAPALERFGKDELPREEFLRHYREELEEGKFWSVESDLLDMMGRGMAVPSEGPTQLRFDYIYFSGTLRVTAVQAPLTEEQERRFFGDPWDILPNDWHPSDHLPVAAVFEY